MSAARFTAGPWRVKWNGTYGPFVDAPSTDRSGYGAAAHHVGIETHSVAAPGGPNAVANANLIAAAPDLYAALENALIALENFTSEEDRESYIALQATIEMASAALARARGGQ